MTLLWVYEHRREKLEHQFPFENYSAFFSKLFPEIPKTILLFGHDALNFAANLLGLNNAATPFGLKAMESLQSLNPDKDRASNAKLCFCVFMLVVLR